MPLSPNWDLAAYELRQWGPTETQPSRRGHDGACEHQERAAFAQPLPLLRLELEDRFGGVVGRRDFEPKEYLRDPAQASRLLAAGTATEAGLELVDTTREAVGYRLDICIKDARRRDTVRAGEGTLSVTGYSDRAPIVIGPFILDGSRAAGTHGRRDRPALSPPLSPTWRSTRGGRNDLG